MFVVKLLDISTYVTYQTCVTMRPHCVVRRPVYAGRTCHACHCAGRPSKGGEQHAIEAHVLDEKAKMMSSKSWLPRPSDLWSSPNPTCRPPIRSPHPLLPSTPQSTTAIPSLRNTRAPPPSSHCTLSAPLRISPPLNFRPRTSNHAPSAYSHVPRPFPASHRPREQHAFGRYTLPSNDAASATVALLL